VKMEAKMSTIVVFKEKGKEKVGCSLLSNEFYRGNIDISTSKPQ